MFFTFLEGFFNALKGVVMMTIIAILFFSPIVLTIFRDNGAWMLLYLITIPTINGLFYII